MSIGRLQQGIVGYSNHVRDKNLSSTFKGTNFVFDQRVGVPVTEDRLTEDPNLAAIYSDPGDLRDSVYRSSRRSNEEAE